MSNESLPKTNKPYYLKNAFKYKEMLKIVTPFLAIFSSLTGIPAISKRWFKKIIASLSKQVQVKMAQRSIAESPI